MLIEGYGPLWNLSSMGGIIFLAFCRMSRVLLDMFGVSEDIWKGQLGVAVLKEKRDWRGKRL